METIPMDFENYRVKIIHPVSGRAYYIGVEEIIRYRQSLWPAAQVFTNETLIEHCRCLSIEEIARLAYKVKPPKGKKLAAILDKLEIPRQEGKYQISVKEVK